MLDSKLSWVYYLVPGAVKQLGMGVTIFGKDMLGV
jgi:hypothetical protein